MDVTVTKVASFDAAHSLPQHQGKCRNLHGHHYTVEVTVGGALRESGPETGMVMDFGDLDGRIQALIVEPLDHQLLNDVVDIVPTAEALAGWMFSILRDAGLPVVRLRLWETPTSYAEVTA